MIKTNLFFVTLLLGLVGNARAEPDTEFLAKIATGPYRDGSDHVHTEPGDLTGAAAVGSLTVVPNVPASPVVIVAPSNEELRKQLVSSGNGATEWLTNASTLITWERYNPRYEGDFNQETEGDTRDDETAVDSKKFYIRGQKHGRGKNARKYRVESYGPRKRHLRRSHHHRRSHSEDSKTGSCTDDYRHCRRRHDRRGRRDDSSSSDESRTVERSRSRRDRDRSRDRSRSHHRRHRSSRDRRNRRSRDSRDRSDSSNYSRGNYGRYHGSYGGATNFAAGKRSGMYIA